MTIKPAHWTETTLDVTQVCTGTKLAHTFGWSFWEHPTKGDEGHVLTVSLDRIGPNGPIVYDTGDYGVPEFL